MRLLNHIKKPICIVLTVAILFTSTISQIQVKALTSDLQQENCISFKNNTPTEEQTLGEEKAPTEEQKPAQDQSPAEDQKPTEGQSPAEEQKPAEEQIPAEDQKPTEEQSLAEEQKSNTAIPEFPQNILNILKKYTSYSQLNDIEKNDICKYYSVNNELMIEAGSLGCNINKSISCVKGSVKYGITLNESIDLYNSFDNIESGYTELYIFDQYLKKFNISEARKYEFIKLMTSNYNVNDIAHTYIIAEVTDHAIADIISIDFKRDNNNNIEINDIELLEDICKFYKVKLEFVLEYIKEKNISISDLYNKLINYQQEKQIFISMDEQNKSSKLQDIQSATQNEEKNTIYTKEIVAPLNYMENDNENINLANGSLQYKENIVGLKGRNGLDLNLNLLYNSDQAEIYDIQLLDFGYTYTGKIVYEIFECKREYYWDGQTKTYLNDEECSFCNITYEYATAKRLANEITKQNVTPTTSGYYYEYNGQIVPYEEKIQGPQGVTRLIEKQSHSIYGIGWDLSLPSIYTIKNKKYYKTSTGEINDFSYGSKLLLNDYYTITQDSDSFSHNNKSSKTLVTYKNGIKEYYDSDDLLIGIVDKFSNTIKFEYTLFQNQNVLSKIIDTVGREINITYSLNNEKIVIKFSLPNNSNVLFNLNKVPNTEKAYSLKNKHDQLENITSYSYDETRLTNVNFPTNANYKYTYKKLNYTVYTNDNHYTISYYSISSRESYDGINSYKKSNYEYSGCCYKSDPYSTTITDCNGLSTLYEFSNKLNNKITVKNAESKILKTTEKKYSKKLPIEITEKTFGDNNSITTAIYLYEYDDKGNVTATWNSRANGDKTKDKHKTTTVYDNRFSIPTKVSYWQDDAKLIEETSTLSSDGKSAVLKSSTINGVLKECSEFTYDTMGNITTQKAYIDNNKYILTEFKYNGYANGTQTSLDGVYLTAKAIDNISELYFYDIMGNCVKTIDGRGYVTQKTYDVIGRVIEVKNIGNDTESRTITYKYNDATNTLDVPSEYSFGGTFIYDKFGNLLTRTRDGKVIESYSYDNKFRKIEEKGALDTTAKVTTYDYFDRPTSIKIMDSASGTPVCLSEEQYSYNNSFDNKYQKVTKTVVGDENAPSTISTTYTDVFGKEVKTGVMYNGEEKITTNTYDYLGNLLTTLTPYTIEKDSTKTYTTKNEYEYKGRVSKVFNVLGNNTQNAYDMLGRKVSETDFKGTTVTFEYDNFSRVIKEIRPYSTNVNSIKTYQYDANGNKIEETTSSNKPGEPQLIKKVQYEYDFLNRTICIKNVIDDKTIIYTRHLYDNKDNVIATTTGKSNITPVPPAKQKKTWAKYSCVQDKCSACNSTGKVSISCPKTENTKCLNCNGDGGYFVPCPTTETYSTSCSRCGGSGKIPVDVCTCGNAYPCSNDGKWANGYHHHKWGTKDWGCNVCHGSGSVNSTRTCSKCNGDGIRWRNCSSCNGSCNISITCSKCNGSGNYSSKCTSCSGNGFIGHSKGSFIENITAEERTYPTNGRHTDGYWYVLQDDSTTPPTKPEPPVDNKKTWAKHTSVENDCTTCNGTEKIDVSCPKSVFKDNCVTCSKCGGDGKDGYHTKDYPCTAGGCSGGTITFYACSCGCYQNLQGYESCKFGKGSSNSWTETCSTCGGDGLVTYRYDQTCNTCGGDGKVSANITCTICNGTGVKKEKCSTCNGTGKNGTYFKGSFIENVKAEEGTYPTDGKHTDGYWYVLENNTTSKTALAPRPLATEKTWAKFGITEVLSDNNYYEINEGTEFIGAPLSKYTILYINANINNETGVISLSRKHGTVESIMGQRYQGDTFYIQDGPTIFYKICDTHYDGNDIICTQKRLTAKSSQKLVPAKDYFIENVTAPDGTYPEDGVKFGNWYTLGAFTPTKKMKWAKFSAVNFGPKGTEKGTFIENVTALERKYPINGYYNPDGYWYELVGDDNTTPSTPPVNNDNTDRTIQYEYNADNKVTKIITVNPDVPYEQNDYISYEYDSRGNRTKTEYMTYSNGFVSKGGTKSTFDGLSRCLKTQAFDRNNKILPEFTENTYTKNGLLLSTKNQDTTITYKYDELGRKISETDSATNSINEYTYDIAGNVLNTAVIIDDKVSSTKKEWAKYNCVENKCTTCNGTGKVDVSCPKTVHKDNCITCSKCDGTGKDGYHTEDRQCTAGGCEGGTITYTECSCGCYRFAGPAIGGHSCIDGTGHPVSSTETCDVCGGDGIVTYKYHDSCSTCGGDGKVGGDVTCTICNGTGIKKENCTNCNGAGFVGYSKGTFIENITADKDTYPSNGRHPDGYWYVLKYNTAPSFQKNEYDIMGRLSKVKENDVVTATYSYDKNGNRESLTYSNGIVESYKYNLANLVTRVANKQSDGTIISSFDYTYYLDGNQATKTDNTGLKTEYIYDGAGRLTSEKEYKGTSLIKANDYTYDYQNNRIKLEVTTPSLDENNQPYNITSVTSYNYDYKNRLLSDSTTLTDKSVITKSSNDYTYDAFGNLISTAKNENDTAVKTETYTYNGFNQQTSYIDGKVTVTYKYNPNGLRISKGSQYYIWDGSRIIAELEGNKITAKYLGAMNQIAKVDETGAKTFYLYNAHGDVVNLANDTGFVVKSYQYDAFGVEKNIDPNDTNPFRYCGEYFDKETGTIYLRARYYSPVLGRFTQQDDWSYANSNDPLSLNLYTYCVNNPVIFIDFTGNWQFDVNLFLRGVISVGIGAIAVGAVIASAGTLTPLVALGFAAVGAAGATSIVTGSYDIAESVTGYNSYRSSVGSNNYDNIANISLIISTYGTMAVSSYQQFFDTGNYEFMRNYIKNPNANKVMLGKYDNAGPTGYIAKAGKDYTYFDMGDEFGRIQKTLNCTDSEMFDIYNKPFLDYGISRKMIFQFSHNPVNDRGFLGKEFAYLKEHHYIWDKANMQMITKF